MTAQLAFDLDALMRAPLPPWNGTPLQYHELYATPEQHAEAFERWCEEHDRFGSIPRSRMWHAWDTCGAMPEIDGHTIAVLAADGRRIWYDDVADDPSIPDALMYQAICVPCRWHVIRDRENDVVEAWHDHALPGWRELPVVPLGLSEKKRAAWIAANQPAQWTRPGSPILTERAPFGTRHVPGRSPFGGYDLGHESTTSAGTPARSTTG